MTWHLAHARWAPSSGSSVAAERRARKDLRDKPFNAVGLFDEALAGIECVVASEHPGGDHVVALGQALALEWVDAVGATAPLLFYHSAFHKPWSDPAPPLRMMSLAGDVRH